LAPGVLDELRRLTPRNEKGQLKHKLFQRLTDYRASKAPRTPSIGNNSDEGR
jgi:hypothetical protein